MWKFSAITSVFQIIPDWYLSQVLKVLVFPRDGFPKIGTVSGYMAGLWTIPFFIILYYSSYLKKEHKIPKSLSIGVLTFLLFVPAEMSLHFLGSWYAVDVFKIMHVAVYIVVPELLLGYALDKAFTEARNHGIKVYIGWAFITMTFYLGAAVLSHFIIEVLLLGRTQRS